MFALNVHIDGLQETEDFKTAWRLLQRWSESRKNGKILQ